MYFVFMLIGIALAFGIRYAVKNKALNTWYEWLLAAFCVIFLLIAGQHLVSSFAEHEPVSAWMGFGIFGGIAVIFGLVAWRLGANSAENAG